MSENLIEILQKQDKSSQALTIIRAFLSKNEFFQQLFEQYRQTPEVIWGICKSLKMKSVKQFKVLFRQGDPFDVAYIILSGTCMFCSQQQIDVFEKKTIRDMESEEKVDVMSMGGEEIRNMLDQKRRIRAYLKNEKGIHTMSEFNEDSQDQSVQNLDFNMDLFIGCMEEIYGKMFLEMGVGRFFGEKALIEQKPRSATVVCKSDSDFAILDRNDFDLVLAETMKLQELKVEFLMKTFPFFGNLVSSGRIFERIMRFFQIEITYRKQEGQNFNSASAKVYLINEGEFLVYRKYLKKIENKRTLPKEISQNICLATLQNGEFFCEEVLEKEEGRYQYTIICNSSQAKLYIVDRHVILKKLPEEVKEVIMAAYYPKQRYRLAHFEDIHQKQVLQERQEKESVDNSIKQKYVQRLKERIDGAANQGTEVNGAGASKEAPTVTQSSHSLHNSQTHSSEGGQKQKIFQPQKHEQQIQEEAEDDLEHEQESGFTVLLMDEDEKRNLRDKFKNLLNTDLQKNFKGFKRGKKNAQNTAQTVDPYPFSYKEAAIIRKIKEERDPFVSNKLNRGPLTSKNSTNLLKDSKFFGGNEQLLNRKLLSTADANKNRRTDTELERPKTTAATTFSNLSQNVNAKVIQIFQKVQRSLSPERFIQENELELMQNDKIKNQDDMDQNTKKELPRTAPIDKSELANIICHSTGSEWGQNHKFLTKYYRSQSPNAVKLAISSYGWNNSVYTLEPKRARQSPFDYNIDVRLGTPLINKTSQGFYYRPEGGSAAKNRSPARPETEQTKSKKHGLQKNFQGDNKIQKLNVYDPDQAQDKRPRLHDFNNRKLRSLSPAKPWPDQTQKA